MLQILPLKTYAPQLSRRDASLSEQAAFIGDSKDSIKVPLMWEVQLSSRENGHFLLSLSFLFR